MAGAQLASGDHVKGQPPATLRTLASKRHPARESRGAATSAVIYATLFSHKCFQTYISGTNLVIARENLIYWHCCLSGNKSAGQSDTQLGKRHMPKLLHLYLRVACFTKLKSRLRDQKHHMLGERTLPSEDVSQYPP